METTDTKVTPKPAPTEHELVELRREVERDVLVELRGRIASENTERLTETLKALRGAE